jgi:hypothetical protein
MIMGGGTWNNVTYSGNIATRRLTGTKDFAYHEEAIRTKKIHESLDPRRINKKVAGILESRDSPDHPNSLPIIFTFDVTGSNYRNAVVAQEKLPELMGGLTSITPDPHVAIWSNDDVNSVGRNAIQVSEFEADIRIDDAIRSTWLVSEGGGNNGESYDLLLYCAARKTVTDSFEKRGRKGYMFLYADEPFFTKVSKADVSEVFDDKIEKDIPLEDIIKEVQAKWHLKILWPKTGYANARAQYIKLFGEDNVITVEGPAQLCEVVVNAVRVGEQEVNAAVGTAVNPGEDFYRPVS